jgi:hypothetical protein
MVRPTNAIIAASVATLVTGFSWVSTPAPPAAASLQQRPHQQQQQQDPGSRGWAHVRLFLVTFVATFVLVAVFQPSEMASPDAAAAGAATACPSHPAAPLATKKVSSAAATMSIDDVMQHVDLHKPPF